jgi:hypothetical protein
LALFAASALLASAFAPAQYPGQVESKSNDTPELRAVAVLEWTGEPGKPKASRIVPITVYDGAQLQDAGLYLARPEPLALAGEVQYQLKQDGRTIGLFDVKNSGQVQGAWVGFGEWKPLPKVQAGPPPKIDDADDSDDKPILHRRHHADDSSPKPGGGSDAKAPSAPDDSDRPTLHKKTEDTASNSSGDNSGGSAPVDPDRPTMKKPKPEQRPAEVPADDLGNVSSLPDVTDPDRPRLKHGRSNADSLKVAPTLMGLPADMQQTVAVSDARNRPDHPWSYSWANPGDELKMKAQLEDMARQALGIAQPAPATAPAKKAVPRRTTSKKTAQPPPPPAPAPLQDEQFRVFELAYGSGATLVLAAHTGGALADEKFVTLIAQPDLYGNVLLLLKNVTDGKHLDETPYMRLVDAVDALADNRGELVFELRGDTSRQFALYRVLRGRADKLFVTFGGNFGTVASY